MSQAAWATRVRHGPTHEGPPQGSEVHLWTARLDRDEESSSSWILDDDERARAGRYRFDRDRRRFLVRRTFVRQVLSGYLDSAPERLRFRTTASGRPELETPGWLSFNTSHSNGLAVLAVARGGSVGVDIESDRPISDAMELARGLFAAREIELLRRTRATARSETFLTLWTRKESVVKAIGDGLTIPLDGFDVAWASRGVVGHPTDPGGQMPYSVVDVRLAAGHFAAVTLGGMHVETRLMTPAAAG